MLERGRAHPLGTVAPVVRSSGVTVRFDTYGRGVLGALERVVGDAKRGDPLAPVTVVVERPSLALVARRQLADRPRGVVNVRFHTWSGLATHLVEGSLALFDRPPVAPPAVLEAVRSAVDRGVAGRFSDARSQPATLRALARTVAELADLDARALDALGETSAQAADVVAVVRTAAGSLSAGVTRSELLEMATERARADPTGVASQLGTVVVYLPRRAGLPELALLGALGAHFEVTVVVGMTGDERADASNDAFVRDVAALAHATRVQVVPAPGARAGPAAGGAAAAFAQAWMSSTLVRSAPSADAEVLAALRDLTTQSATGTGLDRMALLYGGLAPYPRLVHDALTLAEIPFHGAGTRALAATAPGRALAGVLAMGDRDWRRDDVVAWLGAGPFVFGGRPVPSARWDLDSRAAGVVKGLDQWDEQLTALAATRRNRARRAARDGDRSAAEGDQGQSCEELRAFVLGVAERLDRSPSSWGEWGEWASALLSWLLGGAAQREAWPEEERAAFDAISDVLVELGGLDWVGGRPPVLFDFRTALDAALEASAPRTARFGHGVFAGRVADAVGLDFDVVAVVGVADGAFFDPGSDDVLLPDAARAACGVALRRPRHGDAVHDLLAVLAAATSRVISYPRFDQRRGSAMRPAPVVLDVLEATSGTERRLVASDVAWGPPADVPAGAFEYVASYPDAVRGHPARATHPAREAASTDPASATEWRLRSLLSHVEAGVPVADHFLARSDRVVAGGLAARDARRSPTFTRFDGHVAGAGAIRLGDLSVSQLERYMRCPRSSFFARELGIETREELDVAFEIDARTRGVLVHDVLERFVREELEASVLAAGSGPDHAPHPAPSETPSETPCAAATADFPATSGASRAADDELVRRVLACAAVVFDAAERDGQTGLDVLWQVERSRIERLLAAHVLRDARYRETDAATPIAVEAPFGDPGSPEVAVFPGARSPVRLRGRIDRIDRLSDGSLCVIDYKSGSKPPPGVSQDDPLDHGSRFQLPVYGLAAGVRYPGSRARAGYWRVGSAPSDWLRVDEAVKRELETTVEKIATWHEVGLFPARPGAPGEHAPRGAHCQTCPFDPVCSPGRVARWGVVRRDPVLVPYAELVEPAPGREAPETAPEEGEP